MAVAREEIDGCAAHLGGSGAAPAGHPPAPKLWLRGRAVPRVGLNDPATLLITDFSREQAWTVLEERSIDDAMRDMVCAGVDALLVVRSDIVTGLITSYDIQGRRPLEFLHASECASRGEIQVCHVMNPWVALPCSTGAPSPDHV